MPYKKKTPARQKKSLGGTIRAFRNRNMSAKKKTSGPKKTFANMIKGKALAQKKAAGQKRLQSRIAKAGGLGGFAKQQRAGASKRRGLAALGARQRASAEKRKQMQAFKSLSKSAQARLIKAQEQGYKTGNATKKLNAGFKKYGARVNPARARILMGIQSRSRAMGAKKKAPPKIPASVLAKMRGRSGQRVKRPTGRVYSTTAGARKAQELAKMRGRSGQRKRPVASRGRPSSRMQRAISTFARGRATARPTSRPAASRRRTGLSTAAAARRSALAARRRRAVASRTRRPGRPSLRRPVTRRRTYRR